MVSTYGDKLIMHLTSHAHAKSSLVLLNLSRHAGHSKSVDAPDGRSNKATDISRSLFLT